MGKTALAPLLIVSSIALLFSAPVSAEETAPKPEPPFVDSFPSAREYYYPLLADPTELGYSGRYLWQVGGLRYGEITVGDYLGLLRWQLAPDWQLQWNIGGGVLGRFDMNTVRNALQVADYTACVPFDIHHNNQTLRIGLWHTSSHLGDDFLARTNVVVQKRSNDLLKAIYSYDAAPWLRVYGGGHYAVNLVNIHGHKLLQGGLELSTPYYGKHRAQGFFAQDLQLPERVHWNPAYTMRTGLRLTDTKRIAAAKIFVEYFSGHLYFLQLMERTESRWGVGISLEIGGPVK